MLTSLYEFNRLFSESHLSIKNFRPINQHTSGGKLRLQNWILTSKEGIKMLLRQRSQKVDLLKKVPMFRDLSNRHLNEVAKYADQLSVKAGKVLAGEGDIGWEFVFILEGKARVEKGGKVINRLASGDFFGEVSLIDRGPRTATVIAETDMTLLIVNSKSFDHLLDTVPGLQKKILISLCQYFRRAETGSAIQ